MGFSAGSDQAKADGVAKKEKPTWTKIRGKYYDVRHFKVGQHTTSTTSCQRTTHATTPLFPPLPPPPRFHHRRTEFNLLLATPLLANPSLFPLKHPGGNVIDLFLGMGENCGPW